MLGMAERLLTTDTMKHTHNTSDRPRRDGRIDLALLAFFAIAAFFLLSEHRAHALGVLPFALLLLCPLLHVFMHWGHGGGEPHHGHGGQPRGPRRSGKEVAQ